MCGHVNQGAEPVKYHVALSLSSHLRSHLKYERHPGPLRWSPSPSWNAAVQGLDLEGQMASSRGRVQPGAGRAGLSLWYFCLLIAKGVHRAPLSAFVPKAEPNSLQGPRVRERLLVLLDKNGWERMAREIDFKNLLDFSYKEKKKRYNIYFFRLISHYCNTYYVLHFL